MSSTASRGRCACRLAGGVFFLVTVWLVVSAFLPSFAAAPAEAASLQQGGNQKVAVFEDVTVEPGEVRENVVVVGGDLVVHGTVTNLIVVVGGDVLVESSGRVGVGAFRDADDTALVSVFGDVAVQPGAVVSGRTVDVAGGGFFAVDALVTDSIMRPWDNWGSIAGWIGSTVFIIVVALIISAIAPRQVAFVSDRARRHPFSSLGWGALGLIVVVPLVTVFLIVTLIGILALLPWWLAVVVALLFGYVSVGALIGRLVLGRNEQRSRVMLAAVVGVVILSIVEWIPIAGAIIVFLALLLGLGATFSGWWGWRRQVRAAKWVQVPLPPSGPDYGPGVSPAGPHPPGTPPAYGEGQPPAVPYGPGQSSSGAPGPGQPPPGSAQPLSGPPGPGQPPGPPTTPASAG